MYIEKDQNPLAALTDFFNSNEKKVWLLNRYNEGLDVELAGFTKEQIDSNFTAIAKSLVSQIQVRAISAVQKEIDLYIKRKVPRDLYSWIDPKDNRVCRFALRQLNEMIGNHKPAISSFHNTFEEKLETWDMPIKYKIDYLDNLGHQFGHIYFHTSHIDWIDSKSELQSDWCLSYLQRKEVYRPSRMPRNKKEKYESVVEELDIFILRKTFKNNQPRGLFNKTELTDASVDKFIVTMMNSWKKYSDRQMNPTFSCVLSKKQTGDLANLANINHLTSKKMINKLIDDEVKQLKLSGVDHVKEEVIDNGLDDHMKTLKYLQNNLGDCN
jgi:hypothetical protein